MAMDSITQPQTPPAETRSGWSGTLGTVLRVIGALALILAAYPSWRHSERAYRSRVDPGEAARAYPGYAPALAARLKRSLERDPRFSPTEEDVAEIRTALTARPLSPALLSFVAIHAAARGDAATADRAVVAAGAMSRRDPLSQLLLVEKANATSDVPSAIRHYHAALATYPALEPRLLPILARALRFPEIRAAIAPYVAEGAAWTAPLIAIAPDLTSADNVAALVEPVAPALALPVHAVGAPKLLSALIAAGQRDRAITLARRIWPDLRASALTKLAVTPATTDSRLGALSWQFPASAHIAAQPDGSGGMTLEISPLASGDAASRRIAVRPGTRYALLQRVEAPPEAEAVRLRWSAACMTPGIQPAFWEASFAAIGSSASRGLSFAVQGGCSLLALSLSVDGGDGAASVSVGISDLQLRPLVQ